MTFTRTFGKSLAVCLLLELLQFTISLIHLPILYIKCIVPWHEYVNITNVYFKLAYVAKLSIIINTGSTASIYNRNIDKRLAQFTRTFLTIRIFVYRKVLDFTKFLYYKIWHHTVHSTILQSNICDYI